MTIKGKFCEEKLHGKGTFDRRSFRWKASGATRVLIGCPRGKWNAKTERCKVGTRAYAILRPATGGSCPRGSKKIRKV